MITDVVRRLSDRCALGHLGCATILMLAVVPVIPVTMARAASSAVGRTALLTAHDGAKGDQFGAGLAVSADGKTAIMGAPYKTVHGVAESGAVYIYTKSTAGVWSLQSEIVDPHPGRSNGVGSWFGVSVALSAGGSIALIGAPHACDPASCTNTFYGQEGAAYVYTLRQGAWTQAAVLSDPHKAYRGYFGMAVSLSGDGTRALVGAPGEHDTNGPAAAYIFTRSGGTWTATSQLTGPDPRSDKSFSFGTAVAISRKGTLAVVGARHVDVGSATDQGTAYTYTYTAGTWTQSAKLTASDGALDAEFGFSVAVAQAATGAIALIGSLGVQEPCPCANPTRRSGNVYVFTSSRTAWTQTAELHDPAHTSWDGFGGSIALTPDGRHALIGAALTYWWSTPAATGRAYLFANAGGTWTLGRSFINPNNGDREYYGGPLALDDAASTLFITAGGYPGDTTPNANQGAVYVYG